MFTMLPDPSWLSLWMPGNWKRKARYELYVEFLQWGGWAPRPHVLDASPVLKWKVGFSNYFRDRLLKHIKRGLVWPVSLLWFSSLWMDIWESRLRRTANWWGRTFFSCFYPYFTADATDSWPFSQTVDAVCYGSSIQAHTHTFGGYCVLPIRGEFLPLPCVYCFKF